MLIDTLKYVHEDKDIRGNVRVYVWKGKGYKKIRIREKQGTPEFRRAYDAAIEASVRVSSEEPNSGPRPIKPNTYGWLCENYMRDCAEFHGMAESTKKVRRNMLKATYLEPVAPEAKEVFQDYPLDRLSAKAIKVLRDRKKNTPDAANNRLKALRKVFEWALEEEIKGITGNPAKEVKYLKTASDGHHTWTEAEVAQFEARHPVGTKARLAMALLLFTGVRRSDVVLLGRQMVRNGWLYFVEQKGRNQKIKERSLPMLQVLKDVIDASPSGNLTYLVTEYGAPFSAAGFGNWFRVRCDEAELFHCSAHGLRKAGATIAANNGATEHELMAIYGWDSPKQAALYTRKANRKKLAERSMHLVSPVKA